MLNWAREDCKWLNILPGFHCGWGVPKSANFTITEKCFTISLRFTWGLEPISGGATGADFFCQTQPNQSRKIFGGYWTGDSKLGLTLTASQFFPRHKKRSHFLLSLS
jgi:hypothetical protein